MKIAFYPGSFDPLTKGHQDVIEKALLSFDKVMIGIGVNPDKKGLFSPQEKEEMINKVYENESRVSVCFYDGLMIEKAVEIKADVIIRGIRNGTDFDYEQNLQMLNDRICSSIVTFYVFPPRTLTDVSSSSVRGFMNYKGSQHIAESFVHPVIYEELKNKYNV